jgi:hypothetical protein
MNENQKALLLDLVSQWVGMLSRTVTGTDHSPTDKDEQSFTA